MDLLLEIGFPLDPAGRKWDQMYQELVAFKDKVSYDILNDYDK